MNLRDRLKRPFDKRLLRLQATARQADEQMKAATQQARHWPGSHRALKDEILPALQEQRETLQRERKAFQAGRDEQLAALSAETKQWRALRDDARIESVERENGQLWRRLQGLRAQRGFRNVRRFFSRDDDASQDQDKNANDT